MFKDTLFIVLLFCSFTVVAQHQVPVIKGTGLDAVSKLEKSQIENLYKLYSSKINPSINLINGREYFPYYFQSVNTPILFFDKDYSSSITLNGEKYEDIYLDYDTFLDKVIYIDSSRFFTYRPLRITLNKDNIDCFELYFVNDTVSMRYFSKDTSPGFNLEDGFYEVVYDKESKFLLKHKSLTYLGEKVKEYKCFQIGYINLGNGFLQITSKKQFINLFGDRSDNVRRFIKESRIKIHKIDKRQIVQVLKFYDNRQTNDK
jgi:hypothetical protein